MLGEGSMKLLDYDGGKLNVSEYALTIEAFKVLYDRDKSKGKDVAIAELSYVYFMCDIKSPYFGYEEAIRGIKINDSLYKKVKEDELVKVAIAKYNELSKSVEARALDSVMVGVNKMLQYFESVDLTLMNKNGTPVYSSMQLQSNIKNFGGMLKEIKKLREEIEKDSEIQGRIRGGGVLSSREKPKMKKSE